MNHPAQVPSTDRELVLDLTLQAPRAAIWRCWTEPDLLQQWFAPAPWTIAQAELDVRPGGSSHVVMRSPDGEDIPNPGIYLEVVPEQRLVFTDAYLPGWIPSEQPFMTAIVELEDAPGGHTRYVARARHWTAQACAEHLEMGFEAGWTQCARQLETLAASL